MKKIIAVFLAALLVLAINVSAFAGSDPTISVSSASAKKRGDDVSFDISISNNPGFMALSFDVEYDNTVLELIGDPEKVSAFGGSWTFGEEYLWDDSADSTYNGKILTLNFKVKSDAKGGETLVKVIFNEATKSDETQPIFETVDGSVVIDVPCEHANTEIIKKKDATCTEKGYTGDTYCNDCKSTIAYGKEIAMVAHEWIDDDVNDKPATCTEGGYDAQKCKNCPATRHINEVGPLDHDWIDDDANDKPATCTEGGYDAEKCSRCPATRHVNEVGPLNHDWVADDANDKAATCTEGGYDAEKCSRCPATRHVNEIDPLGHDLDEDITEEATCTEPGKKDVFCKREGCDYVEEDVVIPALGHKWGSWTTVKEATEKEKGLEKRTCQREGCQSEETRETKKISKDNTFIILGGKNKDNKNGNETNPNTGATVCVGIAALVALSGAGAVISRKKH